MGIELQGLPFGVRPGQSAQFNFVNPVQAYAWGLWAFTITFGAGDDHWVQNFSIKLLPNQPELEGVVGNQVSAIVNVALQDSSGHTIDVGASLLYPVCVAITGSNDPNTMMSNVSGILTGSSQGVSLPGSTGFSVVSSFLSGFNLGFPGDHQILGASAGCGITYSQSQGLITASAAMFDGSGNEAQTATVDAGYIASVEASPGCAIQEVTNQTTSPIPVTMSQLTSVSQAMVLLRSWKVQYDGVHNVQSFTIGSQGPPKIAGNVVTLPNLYAAVSDNSGNVQDNSVSSATALVIALP